MKELNFNFFILFLLSYLVLRIIIQRKCPFFLFRQYLFYTVVGVRIAQTVSANNENCRSVLGSTKIKFANMCLLPGLNCSFLSLCLWFMHRWPEHLIKPCPSAWLRWGFLLINSFKQDAWINSTETSLWECNDRERWPPFPWEIMCINNKLFSSYFFRIIQNNFSSILAQFYKRMHK